MEYWLEEPWIHNSSSFWSIDLVIKSNRKNWALAFHAQFSSVTHLCLTLCDPTNRSTPGLPVHHQLLEFTQTHLHWVSDAIQPPHPLSSPSPPRWRLFPSIRVFSNESIASVLPMNILDWFPLGWTGWISLQSRRLSRVFSNTTVQKHQFFGAQLSL